MATDILSRGIDIDSLSHVVNFDMPQDAEDYVHRVGRTARAASTGMAITFVNENDMYRVHKVEKLIERELPKLALPEGFGSAPSYDPTRRDFGRGGSRGGSRPGGGGRDRNKSRGPRPEGAGEPRREGGQRPPRTHNHAPRPAGERAPRPEGQAVEGAKPNRNRNRNRNRNKSSNPRPQGTPQAPAQE